MPPDVILGHDELTERLELLLQTDEPTLAEPLCEQVLEALGLAGPSRPPLRREMASHWIRRRGRLNGSPTPLRYLDLLDPEIVNIDKSVVTDAHGDPAQQRVPHRLVEVAHGLDMDVTAEGVETEADRDVLLELGVHQGQGWLYDRPTSHLN